jgi:hypothetical protein
MDVTPLPRKDHASVRGMDAETGATPSDVRGIEVGRSQQQHAIRRRRSDEARSAGDGIRKTELVERGFPSDRWYWL